MQSSGSGLFLYLLDVSTYFYENSGLADADAFDLNMAGYALGAIGTLASWFLIRWACKRTIYILGLAVLFTFLVVIGLTGIAPSSNKSASWAIDSMILAYSFVYDLTIGPVCYSLVAEISSTRLEAKSIVLARNFYNIACIINNVISPRDAQSNFLELERKAGLFWAGICFLCLSWTYFRLPEPKGRTCGEINILFQGHVPARKFRETVVYEFSEDMLDQARGNADVIESGMKASVQT